MDVLAPQASGQEPRFGEDASAIGVIPPVRPPEGAELPDPAVRLDPVLPTNRLRGWLVTLSVTLLGALVRFWNLGFPTDKGTPVFDEKHYAPQAWEMLRNGGYEDNAGYELVVHPPLGKTLMSFGEWIFGYDAWGWRFVPALAGAVCILLMIRIARRLTGSDLLGAIAGVLFICDGVSHVQARIGMLDIFLQLFVLAGFACLLVDRHQVRARLAVAVREGWATTSDFGPRLGFRWWRFATGICTGLGCGVKWDGLYFVAAFGVLSVFFDLAARRAAGVRRPWLGTIVRDLGPALWSLLVIPVLAYLGTWWAWFGSETGIDRHAVAVQHLGSFWFVPGALRSLLYYSGNVLHFHETLTNSAGNHHPWESKPWSWPMGLRPMLYAFEQGSSVQGCGQTSCYSVEMLIGTPAMWWLAFPMLAWGLWRMFARFDWRYAAVIVTYLFAWLPWFSNLDRQMYFFYALLMAPFLVLGITLVLGEVLGSARVGLERRGTGLLVVALYLGLVVANFAWLWPILNGDPITEAQWNAELWLPSWR